MERLKERIEVAFRALITLEQVLQESAPGKIVRDAAIQRFEYTVEAAWKAAQRYLQEVEGLRSGSPKGVVRACFQVGLLSEEESELALQIMDDRNLTVHTYNEPLAEALFARLPEHARLIRQWLERLAARVQ